MHLSPTLKLGYLSFNICSKTSASSLPRRFDVGASSLNGHQGKSERRRFLCYAGTKSPSRQLDDFEIVMLNSSFIQTRRPVTPASLLLSFQKRAGLNPVVLGVFTAIMTSAETLRARSAELIIAVNTPKTTGLSPAPFKMTKAKTPE